MREILSAAAFTVQSMSLDHLANQIKSAKNGLAPPNEEAKRTNMLVDKIKKSEDGLTMRQLFNKYNTTSDDIERLKSRPELIYNSDNKGRHLTFLHRPPVTINIDEDIKQLWRQAQIPPQTLKEIHEYADHYKHMEELRMWRTRNEAVVQAKKEKKANKKKPSKRKKHVSNSHLASNPDFAFLFT